MGESERTFRSARWMVLGTRGLHMGTWETRAPVAAPRLRTDPPSLLGFPHWLLVFHWALPRRKAPLTDRAWNHCPVPVLDGSHPAGLHRRLSLKWGEACGPGPLASSQGAGTPKLTSARLHPGRGRPARGSACCLGWPGLGRRSASCRGWGLAHRVTGVFARAAQHLTGSSGECHPERL